MGCTTSAPEKIVPKTSYVNHPEAVIIACYFNPTNSSYRKQHFLKFYESIKHCNYRIIECMIGDDRNLLLPPHDPNIEVCHTNILLWHKECLLNILIKDLDPKYKFVFWLDGDIQFTNMNWIVESVNKLKEECSVLQPFEYAFHLNKDELTPSSTSLNQKESLSQNGSTPILPRENRRVWKSYGANFEQSKYYDSLDYDIHGHVGFAWGIRRSILMESEGLYDKALIGGADHIMAHAITSKIAYEDDPCDMISDLHICITKTHTFKEELMNIANWSYRFQKLCNSELGYVKGDVYHYWHGDLSDRNYFHRIRDFSPYLRFINEKENGLYVTDNPQILEYINNYFDMREVSEHNNNNNNNNNNDTEGPVDGSSSKGNQTKSKQHRGYYYNEEEDVVSNSTSNNSKTIEVVGMNDDKVHTSKILVTQTSSLSAVAVTDISQKLTQHKKKVADAFYYMDSNNDDDSDDDDDNEDGDGKKKSKSTSVVPQAMNNKNITTAASSTRNSSSDNNNNRYNATSIASGIGFYYSDYTDDNTQQHHQHNNHGSNTNTDIANTVAVTEAIHHNAGTLSEQLGRISAHHIDTDELLFRQSAVGFDSSNIINRDSLLSSNDSTNFNNYRDGTIFRQSAVGFSNNNRDSLMSSNDRISFNNNNNNNRDGIMFRQSAVGFSNLNNRDSLLSSNDSTSFNNNRDGTIFRQSAVGFSSPNVRYSINDTNSNGSDKITNGNDNYGDSNNVLMSGYYSCDTNYNDAHNSGSIGNDSNHSNDSMNNNRNNSTPIKSAPLIDTAVLVDTINVTSSSSHNYNSSNSPKSSPLGKLGDNNNSYNDNNSNSGKSPSPSSSLLLGSTDDNYPVDTTTTIITSTTTAAAESGGGGGGLVDTPQKITHSSSKFGLLSSVAEDPAVLRASQSSDCTSGNESEQ